ncbi:MAG: hypothetical protein K2L12_06685 [Clostridia bacterium]|nr:hypothetical protein [Clostridia bacterium]
MIELSKIINYEPTDISFIQNAMHCQIIHKDGDGKNRKNYTNDSYATLGDAILKFVLTEYLFDKRCNKAEITSRKKDIEKNDTLFNLCNESCVFNYAYNDKYFSPDAPKQNKVPHSKHDVYIEAIIAAIYKDKGFEYCRKWIISFFQQYGILFD